VFQEPFEDKTQNVTLERWEAKIRNREVTAQVVWPIAKFLTNWEGLFMVLWSLRITQ
jgi:hypothetical protein